MISSKQKWAGKARSNTRTVHPDVVNFHNYAIFTEVYWKEVNLQGFPFLFISAVETYYIYMFLFCKFLIFFPESNGTLSITKSIWLSVREKIVGKKVDTMFLEKLDSLQIWNHTFWTGHSWQVSRYSDMGWQVCVKNWSLEINHSVWFLPHSDGPHSKDETRLGK